MKGVPTLVSRSNNISSLYKYFFSFRTRVCNQKCVTFNWNFLLTPVQSTAWYPNCANKIIPSNTWDWRYSSNCQLTLPMKGTRWCSHIENISISLTTTISSWSSSKIASFKTSKMKCKQEKMVKYTCTKNGFPKILNVGKFCYFLIIHY